MHLVIHVIPQFFEQFLLYEHDSNEQALCESLSPFGPWLVFHTITYVN